MLQYIIDGYNVIKSDKSKIVNGSLEERRNELISLIEKNSPQGSTKNSVTIVFDGRSDNPFSGEGFSRQNLGKIEVLYSENTNADRIIEKIVLESPSSGNIVVVTDDKGIKKLLGYTGARFMAVEEFNKNLYRTNAAGKRADNNDEILKEINRELGEHWLNEK